MDKLLAAIVGWCARKPLAILLCAALVATASGLLATNRLSMSTNLHELFDARLAWLRQDAALRQAYPQFTDLIVAVIDARIPEEADATADGLAARAGGRRTHFVQVWRPDGSPICSARGCCSSTPRR